MKQFITKLFTRPRNSHLSDKGWRAWYLHPLFDLGEKGNPSLSGIFSPLYDQEVVNRYVHTLFQEDANSYAQLYSATDYFSQLLSDAFARIGLSKEKRTGLRILDIGSGAGNSIFPLLSLCPGAQIIASDLSLDLLVLLKQALLEREQDGACGLLQLNAEELDFIPESFDLVVGAAVLHHLLAPEKVFEGCGRILKPGGTAIFFEPFEAGNSLLCLMYQAILDDSRNAELTPDVATCLRSHIADLAFRRGRDKTDPAFQHLEDKWLFTQRYIVNMARQYGLVSTDIHSIYDGTRNPFTQQTEVYLRLAVQKDPKALPTWAWDIIAGYDNHFSEDLKSDLLIEGTIILQKKLTA